MMMSTLPVTIRNTAVRSYFHTNFSPRNVIDRNALNIIPVAALLVNSVKSANGKTPTIQTLDWRGKLLTCMGDARKENKEESK